MIKRAKNFLFVNSGTKQTIFKNTFWLLLAEFVNKGLMFFISSLKLIILKKIIQLQLLLN